MTGEQLAPHTTVHSRLAQILPASKSGPWGGRCAQDDRGLAREIGENHRRRWPTYLGQGLGQGLPFAYRSAARSEGRLTGKGQGSARPWLSVRVRNGLSEVTRGGCAAITPCKSILVTGRKFSTRQAFNGASVWTESNLRRGRASRGTPNRETERRRKRIPNFPALRVKH